MEVIKCSCKKFFMQLMEQESGGRRLYRSTEEMAKAGRQEPARKNSRMILEEKEEMANVKNVESVVFGLSTPESRNEQLDNSVKIQIVQQLGL